MNIHSGTGEFILSKRRGKGNIKVAVEHRQLEPKPRGPTPERLAKAEEHFVVGNDRMGGKVYTFKDAPLDRMYSRSAIDPVEYQALQKLKLHWHCSGMPGAMRSPDLNRIFAADLSAMSNMPAAEAQAHHRHQWRRGYNLLTPRARIVVERVVCREQTLALAGFALGAQSKPQATAAASELLRDAGYRLATLWGMH